MAFTKITAGMTPDQYITAVNANMAKAIITSVTPVTKDMLSGELQDVVNTNLTKSSTMVGVSGTSLLNTLNGYFDSYGFDGDEPESLSVNSVEDFTRIAFTDTSGGEAKHEIWESYKGGDYTLHTTLNEGVVSYDYVTMQNRDYSFRIRSKKGSEVSPYAPVLNIHTPWVFRTDQSVLAQVNIVKIKNNGTNDVIIKWGDGTEYDVPKGVFTEAITKDYAETGIYWIYITGAIDDVNWLEWYTQAHFAGTDITKWCLPAPTFFGHFWNNGFIGDVTDWEYPTLFKGCHLIGNPITGDLNKAFDSNLTEWWDCHVPLGMCATGRQIPPKMTHMMMTGPITGDISHWRYPKNYDYDSWMIYISGTCTGDITYLFDGNYEHLHNIFIGAIGLDGDLSGWFIGGDYIDSTTCKISGNSFTKLPRGNFYMFSEYLCASNNCNTAEIDAILAAIDASVTADAPQYNCAYTLNGVGMGIPSAAGLISKTSIEGKYAAAGKTISIIVNS